MTPQEILVLARATGRAHYARICETLFDSGEGRALLRERPELCSAQVDYDAVRDLPGSALGFRYVSHLDRNGLSADYQAAQSPAPTPICNREYCE